MTEANPPSELFFDIQQKTDKQHILDNPDTYIGSVEHITQPMWIMNPEGTGILQQTIQYIPGLYKLFDEGIVNCRDHVVRMQSKIEAGVENALPVTHIEVTVEPDGTITMLNDGNGMDVVQKDGVWAPELAFAQLRTSTNYNKDEKRIVGGKNGFGFKLVLIWSSYGRVEIVDHIRGLKYIQEFSDNLDVIREPVITKCKNKPYTKITFRPDYARLGIEGLTPEMVSLFHKRTYDISAVTDKRTRVKFNDNVLAVRNIEHYVHLYIGSDKTAVPRVYETAGDRWEYAVALSPFDTFTQVSLVNGIHTSKGGQHVDYVVGQIVQKIVDIIEKKKKVKVKPSSIKDQLFLFLRCDIENPSFDSQTKDYLNTPVSKFGSKCQVSNAFVEKVISKLGVADTALKITELKDNRDAKKTDGKKASSVRGIPKLTDANHAGTVKSKDCILILCEGDSAKSGIISGLSSDDRNYIGVYPLRGKLLNVRGESVKKIAENAEIADIKRILGLVTGKHYGSLEEVHKWLRYGKVLFMTDQDLDGSHIKGLCINLFACEWPSLLEIPGFIGFMNTPILKAHRGNQTIQFYNDGEFETWKQTHDLKGWTIKYYKGLGTSTPEEFKKYFREKKMVDFECQPTSIQTIDMVFNKQRANHRKEWLNAYDRHAYLDTSNPRVSYEDFIYRELVHFSKYDCDRSIPNMMDGLKISQRKILFAAFKRNLTSEIKVAQFGGYVSEHSGYHHGEVSLNAAIVSMAQTFVGSNNINLFVPNGQFGTRLQGGKDSASERYIFTALESIARTIFPSQDFPVLDYLNDDGLSVEPLYYTPILPMILVNGSEGIGTGFSTKILCYHPETIIRYLKRKLRDEPVDDIEFIPYYEGFRGSIVKTSENKFLTKGVYTKLNKNTIQVTELPVGFWTEDFKMHLEKLCNPPEKEKEKEKEKEPSKRTKKSKEEPEETEEASSETASAVPAKTNKSSASTPLIKQYKDISSETDVNFTIEFAPDKLDELEAITLEHGCNGVDKTLKLFQSLSTNNMHLFDDKDQLRKYERVEDIIDAYFPVRLEVYQKRKNHLVQALEQELVVLSNKVRYIQECLDNTIDLRRKKKEEVDALLSSKGFHELEYEGYKYLTKLPMDSVTEENVATMQMNYESKVRELERTRSTSIQDMWLSELDDLSLHYARFCEERKKSMYGVGKEEETSTHKTVVRKKASSKK